MSKTATFLLASLASKLRSCLRNQDDYGWDVRVELVYLSETLKLIRPAVSAAEDTKFAHFLYLAKDCASDAEDVLDDLQYRILETTLKPLGADRARQVRKDAAVELHNVASRFHSIAWSRNSVTDQQHVDLDDVMISPDDLPFAIPNPILVETKEPPRIPLGPSEASELELFPLNKEKPIQFGETELVGRGREKERILRFLMDTHGNVKILPVVGRGGLGKTALAQWAYNEDVVKQHFNLRAWVHASESFSAGEVMLEILKSAKSAASIDRPQNIPCIQETLSRELDGKRFLIVLDSLWDDSGRSSDQSKYRLMGILPISQKKKKLWDDYTRELEILFERLYYGREGSKILITTRSESVARRMVGYYRVYPLDFFLENRFYSLNLMGLESADCWSLLKQCVFADENPNHNPQLEDIAITFARMLNGSPLEVKIIGALLKSKLDESFWRGILKEYLVLEKSANAEILPSIRICYAHLSEHLKRCFAHCSLFPRDYDFEKDRLVRIWIALGFVLPSEGKKLEDIGRDYFDELSQRFFFEKKQHQDGYMIHDLLHEMACQVARDECLILTGYHSWTVPRGIRHLRIRCTPQSNSVGSICMNVRSLIIHGQFNIDLAGILECFKGLRVLILSEVSMKSLPQSIGGLIHLRYLELHKIDIAELPESVCRLYHLQALDMRYCINLLSLPTGLHDLINLRYLKQ